MNRAARSVLRKLGTDHHLDLELQQRLEREAEENQDRLSAMNKKSSGDSLSTIEKIPDELLSESEKRHEQYRRRQAIAGRFTPAVERLPIMTAEERQERDRSRPKWSKSQFEGPLEKLIEKYKDIDELKKHLSLGQTMKYQFTEDGRILDREGNVIFDGKKLVGKT